MTGTIIAHAITIASAPIITHIYSPEEFGIFALYIATLAKRLYEVIIKNKEIT